MARKNKKYELSNSKKWDDLGRRGVRLNFGNWDLKDFERYSKMQDRRLKKEEQRDAKLYDKDNW